MSQLHIKLHMKKIYNESKQEEKWKRQLRQAIPDWRESNLLNSEKDNSRPGEWDINLGDSRKAKSLNTNSKAYRPDEDVAAGYICTSTGDGEPKSVGMIYY